MGLLLAVLIVVDCTVLVAEGQWNAEQRAVLLFALALSQVALATLWFVYGWANVPSRAAVWFAVAAAWSVMLGDAQRVSPAKPASLLVLHAAILGACLWLLAGPRELVRRRQFSLRTMFVGSAAAAGSMAVLRWADLDATLLAWTALFAVVAAALALLAIVIVSLPVEHSTRWRMCQLLLAVAVAIVLIPLAALRAEALILPHTRGLAVVLALQAALVAVALLVLRVAGFALERKRA